MAHSIRMLVVLGCLLAPATLAAQAFLPGDVIANRQRLMKLMGASWADIQAKARAGNVEAVAVNAETIAVTAPHIPALFPPGSAAPESKAKPEIWQRWDEFQGAARTLQAAAERLRDASRAKDAAEVETLVKAFVPQTCGACHTAFRR